MNIISTPACTIEIKRGADFHRFHVTLSPESVNLLAGLVAQMYRDGMSVTAVKQVRRLFGCCLKDAKWFCDDAAATSDIPAFLRPQAD